MDAIINKPEQKKPDDIPGYKRLQQEALSKLKRVYMITPENKKAGTVFTDMTGKKYQVQTDGSWRRVR